MKTKLIFTLIIYAVMVACSTKNPVNPPEPLLPIPSEKQLEWQKKEMLMFVHFGIKTFYPSDNHMGEGGEDPKLFNPKYFDAKQWIKAAKAGGFKGIVITSKHHDGFCNWQTKTTDHGVSSSPWLDGKGDVLKQVADACHESGMLFGIYLSVWDRNYEISNHEESRYSAYYEAQLTELLTQYGNVDELWFDGFGAENMKVNFENVSEIIKKHQPDALVYDSGTLVEFMPESCARWPGKHGGVKDPNWSFTNENKNVWYPCEASLIAQGNWFYNNTPIISLDKLKNYYRNTVGLNAVALINVAPNTDGLIDEASITRLEEFKNWIIRLEENDLARGEGIKISASSIRGNDNELYGPQHMIDGNYDTYFATDDSVKTVSIEIDLGATRNIEGVILQEYIPLGQRVSSYVIECYVGKQWVEVASQSTIGYKKLIMGKTKETSGNEFPKTNRIRLLITGSRGAPVINAFSVIGSSNNNS